MYPVSFTNIHHGIKDLVYQGMVENTKSLISGEWNITFVRNEIILKLCLG